MAREILFKAKRIDNGEWVEGSLITGVFCRLGQDIPYIFCPEKADYDCFEDFSETNGIFEVQPDTICQYTGLTDKNGNKIWENDVVKRQDLVFTSLRKKELRTKIGYVDFSCDGYGNGYWAYWWDEKSGRCNFGINRTNCEVIGNIFDNPELLGEGADNG